MKVSLRGQRSWCIGSVLIALGAALWWAATVWIVRIRQQAGNQILVARLSGVLNDLTTALGQDAQQGMPEAAQTQKHIETLRTQGLPELLTDKALAVVAGVTVPAAGSVSIVDEIEGVHRVVQRGFTGLLAILKQSPILRAKLDPFFEKMDSLGQTARPLSEIDQGIKDILAGAQTTATGAKALPQDVAIAAIPHETVIVHRVLYSTYLLDLVSVLLIVTRGMFVLIAKNPGFGSSLDYLTAFFWGLGIKLGTDASRLGPGDVRNAFGIKIPASGS